MKKETIRKLSIAGLIILILYALAGFFLVPWIARDQLLKKLPEVLGREVTLDKVHFNPFTLAGGLEQFQVLEADGDVFLSLGRLHVNVQASSVVRKGITFKEINLGNPYLGIKHLEDGVFNFSDLLGEPTEAPSEVEESSAIPVLRIGRLAVDSGTLSFRDSSPKNHYEKEIRDISFSMEKLSTEPGKTGSFSFSAASETAEAFSFTGSLEFDPVLAKGTVSIVQLELPRFLPYLESYVEGSIRDGLFSLRIEYELQLSEKGPDLKITDGSLNLEKFALRTLDAEEDIVAWDSLDISGITMDLLESRIGIDSVSMSGTTALLRRHSDGQLNIRKARVDSGAIENNTPEETNSEAAIWGATIGQILVSDTNIHLLDEMPAQPAELFLNFPTLKISNFNNLPDESFEVFLEAINRDGGDLSVKGSAGLVPVSADLSINMNDWNLNELNSHIQEVAPLTLSSGSVSVAGTVRASLQKAVLDQAVFTGDMVIKELASSTTEAGEPLFTFRRLGLEGIHFDHASASLSVDLIDINSPEVLYILHEEGGSNLPVDGQNEESPDLVEGGDIMVEDAAEEEGAGGPQYAVNIDTFSISNGLVSFRDQRQTPSVNLSLDNMTSTITGLTTDRAARPDFKMEMQVMGITPLLMNGSLNLLLENPFADLDIQLNSLEMTPFAPYFSRYVGYYLDKGLLNLDLAYKVEEQQLVASNHIVLNQLTLGEKSGSPDATGLPVPLALGLLKDGKGNIDIDLPIEGDLSDPEFRLGGVIGKALVNLLVKVVSSPFSILAGLAGADAEDLQTVTFLPGRSELDEVARSHLDTLATALSQRPVLNLEISASIDPRIEIPAIGKDKLIAYLEANFQVEENPEMSAKERYDALLEKAWRQDHPVKSLTGQLPPREEMEMDELEKHGASEDDLNQLALQRKQAIRNYLASINENLAGRIFILEYEQTDSGSSEAHLSLK